MGRRRIAARCDPAKSLPCSSLRSERVADSLLATTSVRSRLPPAVASQRYGLAVDARGATNRGGAETSIWSQPSGASRAARLRLLQPAGSQSKGCVSHVNPPRKDIMDIALRDARTGTDTKLCMAEVPTEFAEGQTPNGRLPSLGSHIAVRSCRPKEDDSSRVKPSSWIPPEVVRSLPAMSRSAVPASSPPVRRHSNWRQAATHRIAEACQ